MRLVVGLPVLDGRRVLTKNDQPFEIMISSTAGPGKYTPELAWTGLVSTSQCH